MDVRVRLNNTFIIEDQKCKDENFIKITIRKKTW